MSRILKTCFNLLFSAQNRNGTCIKLMTYFKTFNEFNLAYLSEGQS